MPKIMLAKGCYGWDRMGRFRGPMLEHAIYNCFIVTGGGHRFRVDGTAICCDNSYDIVILCDAEGKPLTGKDGDANSDGPKPHADLQGRNNTTPPVTTAGGALAEGKPVEAPAAGVGEAARIINAISLYEKAKPEEKLWAADCLCATIKLAAPLLAAEREKALEAQIENERKRFETTQAAWWYADSKCRELKAEIARLSHPDVEAAAKRMQRALQIHREDPGYTWSQVSSRGQEEYRVCARAAFETAASPPPSLGIAWAPGAGEFNGGSFGPDICPHCGTNRDKRRDAGIASPCCQGGY